MSACAAFAAVSALLQALSCVRATADSPALGLRTSGFPFPIRPATADTSAIPRAPPPGVHPRVFFQTSELPALRKLLTDEQSVAGWTLGQNGNAPVPGAGGYLYLRRTLAGTHYKEDAPAARDVRMPLFVGPYRQLYDDLLRDNARSKAGSIDLTDAGLNAKYGKGVSLHASNVAENGFGFVGLYGKLSGAAFVALISEGEAPFYPKEMGKVLGAACHHHHPIWTPIQDSQNYSFYHDSPDDLGTAYDWLYNDMVEEDRVHCRDLIAAMTGPDRRELGMKWVDFPWSGFNWNWVGWHQTIVVLAASIEGEYFGSQYHRFAKDCNLVQSRYFILESSEAGLAREGLGYHTAGMHGALPSTMVTARAHNNLFETESTRAALHRMLVYRAYTAEPWIDQYEALNNTVSDWDAFSHGDNPGRNGPRSAIVMRKYFPSDPLAAWSFEKSDRIIHFREPLMAAVFATNAEVAGTFNNLSAIAKTSALPENLFCRDRGEMIVRDHWRADATMFDFEVKMNALSLGHNHVDRNSFYLYSRGRAWIIDNRNGDVENIAHQTVLIDGIGQGGGATPTGADSWPPMPGIFLEYAEGTNNGIEFAFGAGDAKPAYDYAASCQKTASSEGYECVDTPYRRTDFTYPPAAYKNKPTFEGLSKQWMEDKKGQGRMAGPIMEFNPVVKAFRSTLFVKTRSDGVSAPWVLIVDDIKKDDETRKYEFIMNLPWAEEGMEWQYRHAHERVEVDMTATEALQSTTDMILKDSRDPGDSGPRLLVRVLRAQGMTRNGFKYHALRRIKIRDRFGVDAKRYARHLVIEALSKSPDFCVFLYPHNHGDDLPETKWQRNKDVELHVSIPGGTKTKWLFSKMTTGRTRITPMQFEPLKNSNRTPASSGPPTASTSPSSPSPSLLPSDLQAPSPSPTPAPSFLPPESSQSIASTASPAPSNSPLTEPDSTVVEVNSPSQSNQIGYEVDAPKTTSVEPHIVLVPTGMYTRGDGKRLNSTATVCPTSEFSFVCVFPRSQNRKYALLFANRVLVKSERFEPYSFSGDEEGRVAPWTAFADTMNEPTRLMCVSSDGQYAAADVRLSCGYDDDEVDPFRSTFIIP